MRRLKEDGPGGGAGATSQTTIARHHSGFLDSNAGYDICGCCGTCLHRPESVALGACLACRLVLEAVA